MTTTETLNDVMQALGARAKAAAADLRGATAERKHAALVGAAEAILDRKDEIFAANADDMTHAEAKGLTGAMLDRLALNANRVRAMANGVRAIAEQADPVGAEIAAWREPNGLSIRRVRTPIGVVAVIFESRPNVTADAGALCLKSGNAAILRGGSESARSAAVIHAAMVEGVRAAGLPEAAIQLVPTQDRAAVGIMLEDMASSIDVVVPRGGRSLVERVQTTARVPVFAHLEGVCHLYVHPSASLEMAQRIVVNAKMRRTGVCGALECLLVDRSAVETHLRPLLGALIDAGCAVRGDAETMAADARVAPVEDGDYGREFLDAIVAVRVVDDVDAAVEHVRAYGSAHTDGVLTADDAVWDRFAAGLDSAIVMRNASTQFADGGEFGMGAEIGIATGKLHARGPVGAEQLTTFRYEVDGGVSGAVRA